MQSKPQSGNGVGYSGYRSTYKRGIDDSNGFWLGLDKMHRLTKSGRYGVEIVIELAAGSYDSVSWPLFLVGNEASEYELTFAGDDGTTGAYGSSSGSKYYFAGSTNGLRFTTTDYDYDTCSSSSSRKCATDSSYGGYTGWWYTCCSYYWNKYRSSSSAYQGKKTRMTLISRIGNCQPYQISLQITYINELCFNSKFITPYFLTAK